MTSVSKAMVFAFFIATSALLGLQASSAMELNDRSSFVTCKLQGDKLFVDLGRTHPPTYFGVVTPSDQLLHLVNPSNGINVLGGRYKTGKFTLDIAGEKGLSIDDGGNKSAEKVFRSTGHYSLIFRDANATAGAELRTFSCDITLDGLQIPSAVLQTSRAYAVSANGGPAFFPVGCNYVPNCGGTGKYCCKKSVYGEPCYCSSCCVARPGSTAVASSAGVCDTKLSSDG